MIIFGFNIESPKTRQKREARQDVDVFTAYPTGLKDGMRVARGDEYARELYLKSSQEYNPKNIH